MWASKCIDHTLAFRDLLAVRSSYGRCLVSSLAARPASLGFPFLLRG